MNLLNVNFHLSWMLSILLMKKETRKKLSNVASSINNVTHKKGSLTVGRRSFLKKSTLTIFQTAIGANIVFGAYLPEGIIPIALLDDMNAIPLPGKHPDLIVLGERPINAETPAHLLDPDITPADLFFVRNNGIAPERSIIKKSEWTLTIDGESVNKKLQYSIAELKDNFETVRLRLTLECGGNGRAEFNPPASGNQWSVGAVGCAEWEGVRLKDVLQKSGIKQDAVYIGYHGADLHLSGDPQKESISRGVPIAKAMEDETMIAWAMNGEDLPLLNGYPLRLVVGGWPASCSGKWLTRISVRNKVHDGAKMGADSYRMPCETVAPGSMVDDSNMCIIESMPVKSLITYPKTGAIIKQGEILKMRGHAWAGDLAVKSVDYSIDFGATWNACALSPPANRLAWQRFTATINFPKRGYYEVWARATDTNDVGQPMILPGWNPKGYLNNACHRIAIKVN